jgi:hypothetical protein
MNAINTDLLFNAGSLTKSHLQSFAPRVDNGSSDVLFLLGVSKIYSFPLGNVDNYQMDLIAVRLPLPPPDEFVKTTKDLGLPEMFGFVTTCLGILLAVYLVRTWKH